MKADVPPPKFGVDPAKGWVYFVKTREVKPAMSTCIWHHIGSHGADPPAFVIRAPGPLFMFSTRLLALQALRQAVEQEIITALGVIDGQIRREQCKTK